MTLVEDQRGGGAPGRRAGPGRPALRALRHGRARAARRDRVRRRVVERHRDRLDLRRSRDVQEVPRPDRGRRRPGRRRSTRAPSRRRSSTEGWRLACRAQAAATSRIDVPPLVTRPKAATVGVGRQVILHPALQKRYVELDEPTLHDQRSDFQRLQDAIDDLELRADPACCDGCPRVLRAVRLPRHGGRRRRPADRRRAGRHHRAPARDRVRPRHDHRRRDPARRHAPARRSPSARC